MRRLFTASVVLALSLGPAATLAVEERPSDIGAFTPAGALAETRFMHSATTLPDGRVLVVGGKSNDSASAEVWEAAASTRE